MHCIESLSGDSALVATGGDNGYIYLWHRNAKVRVSRYSFSSPCFDCFQHAVLLHVILTLAMLLYGYLVQEGSSRVLWACRGAWFAHKGAVHRLLEDGPGGTFRQST
jgi:hypothetical protein